MALPALTHHEIVALAEPFVRQGLHVDLAATDRAARRLAFGAIEAAAGAAPPALRVVHVLEARERRRFLLERTVQHPCGLQARLQLAGADAAALLARAQAIDPQRHFEAGAGFVVARSWELWDGAAAEPGARLYLSRAEVQLAGLRVVLTQRMPKWRNVAAELVLTPASGRRPDFPEDLLAVLGWDWARLVPDAAGWTSRLRLRGGALRRSRTAERELSRAAHHLARLLAEPPAAFHDRCRWARWGVVLRRAIPALSIAGMVAGALLLLAFADRDRPPPGLWLAALNYVPLALLAVAFSLQELPRFEIPPLPRRSAAPGWWPGEPARGVTAAAAPQPPGNAGSTSRGENLAR